MVRRNLGLKRLPDVETVSGTLDGLDKTAVKHVRSLSARRCSIGSRCSFRNV